MPSWAVWLNCLVFIPGRAGPLLSFSPLSTLLTPSSLGFLLSVSSTDTLDIGLVQCRQRVHRQGLARAMARPCPI